MQQHPSAPTLFADGKLWVAIAALVQPWMIALWKRFVRRGTIRIYPTGNIELGYSNFGPTIGLRGTVHAIGHDVFVKSARLLVIRAKDNAQLHLNWFITRPTTINLEGPQPSSAELAASFLLKKSDPAAYHIVFSQPQFATEHTAALQAFAKEWNEYGAKHTADAEAPLDERYEDFRKQSTTVTQLWSELNNTFFWHAGAYRMRLSVAVESPATNMDHDWTFQLTDQDASSLRLNVVAILQQMAGLLVSWNFAYPKYADTAERSGEDPKRRLSKR